jgi:excisionase family DNA binding protein
MNNHPTPIADDLLRGAAEIAAFTGFTEPQTARLLHNGKLPAFKIGRLWVMKRSVFVQWTERREPVMPPAPPALTTIENSHPDERDGDGGDEGDVEVLTLPPGSYHQRKLLDGRIVILRRGPATKLLTAREQQFREIDQRRAQRE